MIKMYYVFQKVPYTLGAKMYYMFQKVPYTLGLRINTITPRSPEKTENIKPGHTWSQK